METLWKNSLIKGKQVDVKIKNNYIPNNSRPVSFDIQYWINGDYFKIKIYN